MTASRAPAIGVIRRCGPHTHHNGETLSVIADSETVARSIPDTVTIDQARSLVSRGEAIWIESPTRRQQAERRSI
jgi:hypothetical protein